MHIVHLKRKPSLEEPMQTDSTAIFTATHFLCKASLSCDPLPLFILLRHVRHRKGYNEFHIESAALLRKTSVENTVRSTPSQSYHPLLRMYVCMDVFSSRKSKCSTYPVVNSALTYPPSRHPSIPTCTGSGDIGL